LKEGLVPIPRIDMITSKYNIFGIPTAEADHVTLQ